MNRMAQDRYNQWLKLPPGPRPPDHYTLLGLPHFCDDAPRIQQASHDRLDQLDKYALSKDPASREDCQRIMNEVARARVVLTDAGKRLAYDVELADALGVAPPQAIVMPAHEPHEAREPHETDDPGAQVEPVQEPQRPAVTKPAPTRAAPIAASRRPVRIPHEQSAQSPRISWLLAGGAALGVIVLAALLITFMSKEGEPAPGPDSPVTTKGPQPPVVPADPVAALLQKDMEEARARCMARLQECRDDKAIMPLIDEWGQKDWQYIMAAIEKGEDDRAEPRVRTVEYEKAYDKLGDVMTHARRTVEIMLAARGPYDQAVMGMDEESIRTRTPDDWTAIAGSLRKATIGALNHRPEDAAKHFETAAKQYRVAAAKVLAMKLPGVAEPKGPPTPAGAMRLVPMGEPFKGPYHVRYLQFSPDGKLLAAAGENEMMLWDVMKGAPHAARSRLPESAAIVYFNFSPDGTRLHHFTRGGISSWDLSKLEAAPAKSEAWTMGGPLVTGGTYAGIVGRDEKEVEIWDTTTNTITSRLRHDSKVQFHAINANGRFTVTLEQDQPDFYIWETQSGLKLTKRAYPFAGRITGMPGSRVTLSPDARFIACCDRIELQFVATGDSATPKPLDLTRKGRGLMEKLDFAPDGRHLLLRLHNTNLEPSMHRAVLIYNTVEGRIVGEAHPSGDDGKGRFPMPTLRCSPDGRLMATGGATGILRVISIDTGKPVTTDVNIGSTIWDIAFSHDSKMLAVLYVDAMVRIYRLVP